MKSINRLLFLFGISLLIAGCGKDPGPIPANMSRIKVECRGLGTGGYVFISVAGTQQVAEPDGRIKSYSCFLYGDVYFDIAVPPLNFYANFQDGGTVADNVTRSDLVTFTSAGEQVVVKTNGLLTLTTSKSI